MTGEAVRGEGVAAFTGATEGWFVCSSDLPLLLDFSLDLFLLREVLSSCLRTKALARLLGKSRTLL